MGEWKITHKYDDIIHLKRPVSGRRAPMSMVDRGAQFSPFAALTGYDGVIQETARLTDTCTTLADGGEALLDEQLREIGHRIETCPKVTFTCFQQDAWKPGGSYISVTGNVKKIDLYRQTVVLTDRQEIPIECIFGIEILE